MCESSTVTLCLCVSAGGVQLSQTTWSYSSCVYSSYSTYLRIMHISRILHILHILDNLKLFYTEYLDTCQSTIVNERRESGHVLYVVPVSTILGRLPLVPVGSTGTIPFEMRRGSADFPGAACDKSKDAGDGCR